MHIIAVDDEALALGLLERSIREACPTAQINKFQSAVEALAFLESNPCDVAFLDIHMRGIGGLGLAEKLTELQPHCKIIFCTGYDEYAVEAFRLHVSGYLIKPITPEAVQKEINHIKGVKTTEKMLSVCCFGNFEVFYKGEILGFKRKKSKELLAVLVDRKGAGMTAKQICAVLFPEDTDDDKNTVYLRQLVLDLKKTLKQMGAEQVLRHETPYYRIDTGLIKCDYLSFLETGKPEFHGEYMTQYSWAEETCARLQLNK